MRRYANKRDNVEPKLIEALESLGVSVYTTDRPFDAILNYRNQTYLAEFKDPKKEGWKSEYTPKQKRFFERFPGWEVLTFRTIDDCENFARKAA